MKRFGVVVLVGFVLAACSFPAPEAPPAVPSPVAALAATIATVEPAPTVETCPPGQTPTFVHGFAALKARLGERMGEPLSCERPGPSGDALQQTSTGMARYRRETNTASFSSRADHWALTERGLVHWTGRELDPPEDARLVEGAELTPARDAESAPPPVMASPPTAVELRFQFTPGDVRTYRFVTRIDYETSLLQAGQTIPPILLNLTFRYRTLDVHADGSATVLATVEEALLWSNRESADVSALEGLGVRMRMAPDGSYTDAHLEQDGKPVVGADPNRLAESMVLFQYPTDPLAVGDGFARHLALLGDVGLPDMAIDSRYVFTGLTTFRGRQVARLEETARVPIGAWPSQQGIQLSGDEAQYQASHQVGLQDGWPVSGKGTLTMTATATAPDGATASFTARMESTYDLR